MKYILKFINIFKIKRESDIELSNNDFANITASIVKEKTSEHQNDKL